MRGGRPEWSEWRARWPNASASRFIDAGDIRWHVQIAGDGPAVLLLHGTGAATHSWRDVLPLLSTHLRVIAPDLPGHGFTSRPRDDAMLSLPGMARSLGALLTALGESPTLGVGHSAGAAILLRRAADGDMPNGALVGLNAAIAPPPALWDDVLAPIGRALVAPRAVSEAAAWLASTAGLTRSLLDSTGTRVDAEQTARYEAFTHSSEHVHATLAMLARWDLRALGADLPNVTAPVTLVIGERDRWVRASEIRAAARALPNATLVSLPDAGHLAHEAEPERIAAIVLDAARRAGIIG